ncbi:DJ-1 protein/PfpI family protein [Mycena indigotica]|uniref:DJ-1 protein/PfpI family protein n=1 Tax=Mycena indigotica TaxID=2126181 RepID=A0A8H6WAV4_9AGAR|nr:DJ-1 protein/PfpI family protein [Mycena indigotica]KAF7311969.1 DJ-1 protein/PfpI family protein [Mycena indigotica]
MLLSTFLPFLAAFSGALAANAPTTCRPASFIPDADDNTVPRRFGFLLYRATDPLDFLGPSEVLFTLGRFAHVDLFYIAETLDLVSTELVPPATNPYNSTVWTTIAPTHTYDNPPPGLDVLVIPGGPGARAPTPATLDFVRKTYPNLDYFMTVCTGAMIAARAGVLEGKNATTNRAAWLAVKATGPNTNWIGDERWVVDGNIWTSSGVAAGIDAMVAFIACFWGETLTNKTLLAMEYFRHPDPTNDPFAVWPNGTYKYI